MEQIEKDFEIIETNNIWLKVSVKIRERISYAKTKSAFVDISKKLEF